MRRAERVEVALRALGEAGEPAALAQRADAVAPAGQDLVRIGLVADVPDQPVVRRVEDGMQRDRKLDDAEAGAEMSAGHGDRVDGLAAQLVGDLAKLGRRQAPQVGGPGDTVEEGRDGGRGRKRFGRHGNELHQRARGRKATFRLSPADLLRLKWRIANCPANEIQRMSLPKEITRSSGGAQ